MTRDLRLPIRSSETPASVVLAAGGLLSYAFLRMRPNQPASHSGDSRLPWSGPDPLLCNEELEDSKSHLGGYRIQRGYEIAQEKEHRAGARRDHLQHS